MNVDFGKGLKSSLLECKSLESLGESMMHGMNELPGLRLLVDPVRAKAAPMLSAAGRGFQKRQPHTTTSFPDPH